jgi:cephalosporin hydroxylase
MSTKAARRTRSRREIGLSFDPLRDPAGPATEAPPVPIADELKLAAIEAVWDRQAWRQTTWLGHRVLRYPSDLHAYQELLTQHRPGTVVLAADDEGLAGRALYMASLCELLGHGRVVAAGRQADAADHPRITWIAGAPEAAEVAEQVLELAGPEPDAMVFLGLGEVLRVAAAFEHLAPLVPIGGFVVVENTVVNGRPVASGFGPGPHEAVVGILNRHPEFVSDPAPERYTVTFNRNGYLRRTGPS